jgi:hypothetical protein
MRSVLIFLMALTLFTACKNKAKASRETESTDTKTKDNSRDNNKDNTDNNSSNTDYNSSGGWTSAQVSEFVDNCVSEAEKEWSHSAAQSYCTCMQQKLERKYPNANDAAGLTENSPELKEMAEKCLPSQ